MQLRTRNKDAISVLKEQTPSHMNTMLNKQPREAAIKKKKTRDQMQLEDIPPTNPGTAIRALAVTVYSMRVD